MGDQARSGDLLVERDGRTGIITFNRPDARNAMTFEMYEGLHDACQRFEADPEIRVVVLRGAGAKSFASGTDIRQFLEFTTAEQALRYEARIGRVLRRIVDMTKPTIAMVQGDAIGGGFGMAIACDLRIAASHARFGIPIARTLGNTIAPTSVALLAATVGPVRAREILLTARLLDAAEAKQIGLVDEVHPGEALEGRVRELAAHLATLAPLTLASVKEYARRLLKAFTVPDAEEIVLSCYLSEDFKEGVRAFLEKRKPEWKGR